MTKTIVDISSLPRRSTEALTTGSRTSLNDTQTSSYRGGVDELDSLIAKMKKSAENDDDIEVSVTRVPVGTKQQPRNTPKEAEDRSTTGLVSDHSSNVLSLIWFLAKFVLCPYGEFFSLTHLLCTLVSL